jgi:phosphatidylglycerol:prolipoprotein diacylglycerol transferase
MLTYPRIDPVAIDLGPIKVHWYGLMYLIGFAAVWILGKRRAQQAGSPISAEAIDDLVFYGAMGAVLGGRLGYILFYNFGYFMQEPSVIFKIWQGGMSFHGGMLGVFIGMWLLGRKYGWKFFQVTDFLAPMVPIGLFAGRIGNFINGELWGRVTDVPWAMVFPNAGMLPRHPSQLYEAFLEGIVLFAIMWVYCAKPRPLMAPSGLWLALYGFFRFTVEFVRMPDAHLGFVALDWMTMGQILSFPMIVCGALLLYLAYRKPA